MDSLTTLAPLAGVLVIASVLSATAQELPKPRPRMGVPEERAPVLRFSPDGKSISFASHVLTIGTLEAASGEISRRVQADEPYSLAVAIAPDAQSCITASGGAKGTIKFWDIRTGKLTRVVPKSDDFTSNMSISLDGQLVAFGYVKGIVEVYDLSKRTTIGRYTLDESKPSASATAFSPDGNLLAVGYADHVIRLWEISSGKQVLAVTFPESKIAGVDAIVFSPDGKLVAAGNRGLALRVWEVKGGKQLTTLSPDNGIASLAFSPDGGTLAVGDWEGGLLLWDLKQGKLKHELKAHRIVVSSLSYSPDGKTLVSGSWDSKAKLWDVGTGELKWTAEPVPKAPP